MKSKHVYIDYLSDILENANKAILFTAGMSEDEFLQDEKTSFAVIRAIEVMGEATKKVPKGIREKYPYVPWREIAGTRDVLVHEYFGVNLRVIWKTVMDDLPSIIPLLEQILADES